MHARRGVKVEIMLMLSRYALPDRRIGCALLGHVSAALSHLCQMPRSDAATALVMRLSRRKWRTAMKYKGRRHQDGGASTPLCCVRIGSEVAPVLLELPYFC